MLRVLLLSLFTRTSVAAGQVISRLKLTVWGSPGTTAESAGAFQKIVAITVAYLFIVFSINIIAFPFGPDYPDFIVLLMIIRSCIAYAMLLFLIVVLWNLRSHIRSKYAIPEGCNTGCDDLLCAVCCSHCAVAQMLRHTTDYDTYNTTCCSETGVPPHVPSIV
jgi:Cys-rich protein (TIGR01571 family)